jgi:hypothetical protein
MMNKPDLTTCNPGKPGAVKCEIEIVASDDGKTMFV